jgi:2-amino-4-hydroxy-6-hydroxymethyldihydropteridine diphosphokinase
MMQHLVYLGLGSNLGNRRRNLFRAMQLLEPEVHIESVSSLYETEPWGVQEQPRFLNCAVAARTDLTPHDLLAKLKSIEKEIGRQPTFRYGPRLVDLDILLYDGLVSSTDELTIPHPSMLERAFVLVPLAEIAGSLLHPIRKLSINQLAGEINMDGIKLFDSGAEDDNDE